MSFKRVTIILIVILIFFTPLGAQEEDPVLSARQRAERDARKWVCFGCGLIGNCLGVAVVNYIDEPVPPAETLVGKSANYVETYIETYSKRVKDIRLTYAIFGCITNTITVVVSYFLTK